MSESNRRAAQAHSKFDSMSTDELNEYLRRDSYCGNSDPDDVLYVMEVLAKRESEDDNCNSPDVQKAWTEFQEYYNTEDNDGKPLHDFDDELGEDPSTPISEEKKTHRGISRGVKSIISIAAVICIFMVGSFTAKAFGYDVFDAIIVWTKDTFGFQNIASSDVEPTPYVKQIPEELIELENLMNEHGLPNYIIPGYIPDGYKIIDLQYADLAEADSVFCQLSNGSNDIMLIYSIYSGDSASFQLEKDALSPEKYESGGTTYYIMTNMDNYFVSWLSDNIECIMSGIPTRDEALKMIHSLNET